MTTFTRALGFAALIARTGAAQSGEAPRPVFSIGQPPQWQFEAAAVAPIRGPSDRGVTWLSYGVHRAFMNPLTGLAGGRAEAYAGIGGRAAGIRLLAQSRAIGLSGGIDWNIATSSVSPMFSFQTAIRRGGLFGRGSMARLDWLPSRAQSLAIGVTVPLFQPLAGRTRPRQTHVSYSGKSGAPVPESSRSLPPADGRALADAATAIGAFSNAYSPRAERVIAGAPGGIAAAMRTYDEAIRHSFTEAVGDRELANRLAARARGVVLDSVLLSVDSLFGRAKENPGDLSPRTNAAAAAIARWLDDSTRLAPARRAAAIGAFSEWMRAVTQVYAHLLHDASDSRFVWMPLELALTADQFDEQSEVDSLIARAVGHPFTDENALTYLRSTDLPLEIARSIYATRSYHVLWTHDFAGRRESGAIDNVGYSMVADAYLPALTAAVKRYDTTGVFPVYLILQDEYFYEPRDNRLWMTILEDPLDASMRLPGDTAGREAHLRARQQELRSAVAASSRLQRNANAAGNAREWVWRLVKVHVNIVEPADFSFRSSHIVHGIPFTPDNIMRDHRKIVFYDLTEADSYRGALLLMGVGIGEHYASATWEDRGYRIRGPATLEVRRAAREALIGTGYTERDIPPPLREVASAANAEHRMNAGDYIGRALQVHNRVGFARKESSIARAMLYDLAPPGSVIIVPDPMWLSDTWAGMLVGAAARGCRVYVIAPAEANAPSPQAPLIAAEHQVMARMLKLRRTLAERIRSSGGDFRIGIFAARAGADDVAGVTREVRRGLADAPWIRDVFPFDSRTLAVLDRAHVQATAGENGTIAAHDETPRAPQLHQKSQLVARPGAIAALLRQPGWDDVLARATDAQSRQTAEFATQLGWTTPDIDSSATRSTDAMIRGYEQTLPEPERRRVSFYFSLGSQNEDPRGIASDGEAAVIVSGVQASAGVVDLFYLMARSQWIDTEQQLTALVPTKSRLMQWIAHRFHATF
ncbi:MAG TPA: hypothetical protein VFJ20_11760 [Gemmatimonadaceae bacterium]|nr:hypothetical protein [Gemmatimonadaceae bacterium]